MTSRSKKPSFLVQVKLVDVILEVPIGEFDCLEQAAVAASALSTGDILQRINVKRDGWVDGSHEVEGLWQRNF